MIKLTFSDDRKRGKMKRLFISISLVLSCFFFFNTSVSAAQNFTLDYDINEHFNYFYELKNNTPFYQFLLSQGDSLINDYFKSFLSDFNHIYILYSSDLLNSKVSIPADSKYVIILSDIYSPTLSYSSGTFYFDLSFSSISHNAHFYYLFYDENAELIYSESNYVPGGSNLIPFSTGIIFLVDSALLTQFNPSIKIFFSINIFIIFLSSLLFYIYIIIIEC